MRYRKHITGTEVQKCIEFYQSKNNPRHIQLEEGCCGYGTFVITADGYKWMIVQEYYVNEWTSHHKVAFCNKLPKVWEQRIEKAELKQEY